jgi:NitT/TauT family transport system ATP-binding protein
VAGNGNGNGAVLVASHVHQDFKMPNGRPRRILEGIDLAIGDNEVVALLGPSGCGKSTLLRILAGLIKPSEGEVQYHGKKLEGLNPGVGIVFQSFALYPWMTVARNIEVVLEAAGLAPERIKERVERVLDKVGLGAFPDAYPRELSGGMKQRVGIARALAVDPELLFMDEPFSQVDALTAESLRAEVIDIWSDKERNPSSVLMVSHDIKEVVYMADRVVVLGANPGRVLKVVKNDLPRPRDYRSPAFLRLVDQLHEIITGHEMPDLPESDHAVVFEPLPPAGAGEMSGLVEYLEARGGGEDLFKIATDTNREFGQLITIAKGAELLDFVDTPKRMVVLTPTGKAYAAADAEGRKKLWRDQLMKMRLFREVRSLVERRERIDQDLVLEIIALNLPQENYEALFDTLVRWGRFGDLFAYDEDRQILELPEDERQARQAAHP